METSPTDGFIGQRLENYDIERLLGAGGMANVYQASDTLHGREVAIKALSPAFLTDPGYVERFRREAHRIAALKHPNIVPMLQFIEQDRGLYVVMPLYTESLRDLLDRKKKLPISKAVRIVTEIGSALAMAHSRGLVHRDVKPGNILLDAHGRAALADFGIARPAIFKGNPDAPTLAGTGLPVGTPQYMPPEQLRGTSLDHRADIYALGVVLYEMLTGRTPHAGSSPFEVAAAALTQPIIPPSQLDPGITAPVEAVIMRALSARAADRYANVKSFVESLQAAAQGLMEGATQPILPVAWPRRHGLAQLLHAHGQCGRAWLRTAALIALALLLVSGGVVAFAHLRGNPRGPSSPLRIDQEGRAPTDTLSTDATTSADATVTPPPGATATTPPPPPLLSLSALHLTRDRGGQCSGSQTISNHGAQRIIWKWSSVQPSLSSSLLYGINAPARSSGLPADANPGVASGGRDTLNVEMRCTGRSYSVMLRDGLGRTQQFTMTSDSSSG
jgi:serine/threonine-protein kinase